MPPRRRKMSLDMEAIRKMARESGDPDKEGEAPPDA